ncbi:hypothetical protein MMC30_004925 [Trapelia coarctata]|nr:hypothetical protein [Trapelia coarctata]
MPGTSLDRPATDARPSPPSLLHVRNVKRRRRAHPSTGGQSVPGNPKLPSPTSQPEYENLSNLSVVSNLAARGDDDSMDTTQDIGSSGPEVNAEKWFDDSNRNVSNNQNVTFENRDPPFYLSRKSSSEDDSSAGFFAKSSSGQSQLARPLPSRMESFGSTSEDFRSVIDDLTVENQKLKQRLKAYERFHSSQLHNDKLFEVRVHGLSPQQKRKLEEKLREFASSLEETSEDQVLFANQRQRSPAKLRQFDYRPKLSSVPTYNSLPLDSAYASMSTSGNASVSQSNHVDTQKLPESQVSRNQNIRSYLQDIPEGLLPRHPPLMTEKSRKKLVVRRLEQLFTGKGASSTKHSQSHQQQEVSQSAAKADRTAIEARGQVPSIEGHREAKMLLSDAEVPATLMSGNPAPLLCFSSDGDDSSRGTDWSSSATPDQRPTRPLDVDPHRAQVPAENMDYIRHLGVASPKLDEHLASEDRDGWVYLNLLTGMAQLHTINVTPEFVRKAVAEVSEKFDLSEDGRKVRWRGGMDGTRMSSDSCSSASPDDNDTVPDDIRHRSTARTGSSRKSGRTPGSTSEKHASVSRVHPSTRFNLSNTDRPTPLAPIPSAGWHKYEPLFRVGAGSEERRGYDLSDDDSLNSSGPNEAHYIDEPDRHQRPEDGPIIFYNRARFCADLSGDLGAHSTTDLAYSHHAGAVLGCVPAENSAVDPSRGPLTESSIQEVDMVSDSEIVEAPMLHGFNTPPVANSANVYSGLAPFVLEASGVGGVRPRDNFAIDVQVRHITKKATLTSGSSRFSTMAEHIPRRPSHHFGQPLRSMANTHRIKSEVLSTRKRDLPPSSLPPPSYVFMTSSSSTSDESEMEQIPPHRLARNIRSSPSLASHIARAAAPLLRKSSTEWTREMSSFGSDDSSIDMLAHAREIDPDSVAAREREFEFDTMVNQAVSKHLPIESLAATAGEMSCDDGSWAEDDSMDGNTEDDDHEARPAPKPKRGRDQAASLRGGVKRLRVRSPL